MFKVLMTALALFSFSFVGQAHAFFGSDDPIYTSSFNNKAIGGYDALSYFQGDGVPVEGNEEFAYEWRGANWYFSSAENLEKFKADPLAYAPQYGGYCAWAAGHGSLAKGDPLVYSLIDGKVYLNYDKSIHADWEPRRDELIEKADANYPDLVEFEAE